MSWLSNIFGSKEENRVVCVEAETDAQSIERGVKLLDTMYPDDQYEETREKEFYCGICKGWAPISTFPHDH